jgi:hypothetical protein
VPFSLADFFAKPSKAKPKCTCPLKMRSDVNPTAAKKRDLHNASNVIFQLDVELQTPLFAFCCFEKRNVRAKAFGKG